MYRAKLGMERSLPFIPRSVSRKPNEEKKKQKVSTKLSQEVSETEVGENATTSTSEMGLKSDCQISTDANFEVRPSNDSVLKAKETPTAYLNLQNSEPDLREENDNSRTLTEKFSLSSKENLLTTDADSSTEQTSFSFSAFVESVYKHNNIEASYKENNSEPQIASTSVNVVSYKFSQNHSTDTSSSSVPTFAEVVNRQSNLPLVDVGALSPRRKVPLFVRPRTPKQHRFETDSTHVIFPKGRDFSVLASKQNTSYTQVREPAYKKFKDNPSVSVRKPEFSLNLPREWELTQCGRQYNRKPRSQQGLDFTVMSYNILAQNLLEDNIYLYSDCDTDVLAWKFRKKRLMAELMHHKPDVICLQEVQKQHYEDFFKPQLQKMGYVSAYIKRSGNKHDGCATFVNASKFQLEESIPIKYYHPGSGGILDRDNVALIVKLKPLSGHVESNRRLFIANTHLLFNPRRGDIKLAQVMILLAELDKCGLLSGSQSDIYHPVILCGDFNSEPHSELYKLLTMGRLEYEGLLCRIISGQQEGFYRGNNITLGRRFVPTEIGISDTCQYLDVLKSRDSGFLINQIPALNLEEGEITEVEMTGVQGTGVLSHNFNLVSAYKHRIGRLRHRHNEITTYHNQAACSVDYIFYGVRCKDVRFWKGEVEMRNIEEGPLHLLGRYGLLADHELQEMGGLPNETLSSDHLCLLASFLLK